MAELSRNAIIYVPDTDPKGVIHMIHGMADHQGRYRDIAQFFVDHSYAVVTTDIKGHGNHVSRSSELGFFGDNAVSRITGDIHDTTMYIRENFPGLPYTIIGQGMGALLATVYFKKYDNFVDFLFLSGMPAYRNTAQAADILLFLLIALQGEYKRSRLVHSLIMGKYFSRFRNEGSDYAWLSLDQDNVNRYENDSKCAFIYTLNGYKTIVELMKQAYGGISWIKKHKNCPIRIMYGSEDPCMMARKNLEKTVALFTAQGYTDVSYVICPNQRHEIFQDSDRQNAMLEVIHDMEHKQMVSAEESVHPDPSANPDVPTHIVLENFIDPEVEKPLEQEEKLDLDEFITSHGSGVKPKVEMIDFFQPEEAEMVQATDTEELLDELLSDFDQDVKSKGSTTPSISDQLLEEMSRDTFRDENQRFLADPNNLDGLL